MIRLHDKIISPVFESLYIVKKFKTKSMTNKMSKK